MPHDTSEFRYLPAQAAALGMPVPAAKRIEHSLADGRRISALQYGDDAPQITLLHGAGLNAHTWDTVALALSRPLLAIDLPGHGSSSWRDDADYSPAALARDIADAMQAWTDRPQLLVGHSLGGLTAAHVAAQHPDLAHDLVLVDIVPGLDTDAAPAVLRDFYAIRDFASRDDAVERAMAFGFGGTRADTERGVFFNTRVRDDGRVEWRHHFAEIIGDAFQALAAANTAEGADPWAALTAVAAPVTLVRGEHGFLAESDVAAFRAHLPTAEVRTVDAGHNVQETAPDFLADLLTEISDRPHR